jgi:hypothetical protein
MTVYRACRTCGRYTPSGEAAAVLCSADCALSYSSCLNCGRYFLKGKGFDGEHCSKQCTVRYTIQRTYGPEPVTIVAEV